MSKYKYWDEDVEDAVNQARMGNADIVEIQFKKGVEAFNIHKQDVVYLAKQFGLNVYESNSKL